MKFDGTQSYEEGWCVSACLGSSYFPEGWMDIQTLDENTTFDNDFEAAAHVFSLAAEGSQYHKDAIAYMEANNFRLIEKD